MFSEGSRGIYDRFRGRLIWPIRDIAGDTIGFGARKLYEDDQGPKYLNTPETALYKKSQVLYGIDLAKRNIAKDRQLVVVEGYTDVMACHLAGVPTAVATCGTAFGTDTSRSPAGCCPTTAPAERSSSPSTATPPARRRRCAPSKRTSASSRRPSWPWNPPARTPATSASQGRRRRPGPDRHPPPAV